MKTQIKQVKRVDNFHVEIEKDFVSNMKSIMPPFDNEEKVWKYYKALQVLCYRYPEDDELQDLFEYVEKVVVSVFVNRKGA